MNRSAYHQEYYGLCFQQICLAKLIDAQEKMLNENRGSGAEYDLIEEYLANNQIVFQALEQKISPMRKSISEALIAICHLLERYCKSCNVCSKKIPCGSECLECSVNDCPHIVCVTCHGLNLRPWISTLSQNSFANRELITSKKMTEGFGHVGGFDHFVFGDHKSLKKKDLFSTFLVAMKIQWQLRRPLHWTQRK